MKGILQIVSAVWPSKLSTKAAVTNWRYTVASSILLLFITGGFFSAAALGMLPWFPGFAFASAIEDLDERINSIDIRAINSDLLDLRTRQCRAIADHNEPAMNFAARQMLTLKADYVKVTGSHWQTPSCDELI